MLNRAGGFFAKDRLRLLVVRESLCISLLPGREGSTAPPDRHAHAAPTGTIRREVLGAPDAKCRRIEVAGTASRNGRVEPRIGPQLRFPRALGMIEKARRVSVEGLLIVAVERHRSEPIVQPRLKAGKLVPLESRLGSREHLVGLGEPLHASQDVGLAQRCKRGIHHITLVGRERVVVAGHLLAQPRDGAARRADEVAVGRGKFVGRKHEQLAHSPETACTSLSPRHLFGLIG